ncbi:cardiolipin synthase (CMP-forming) [Thermotomaculum hydrothermale]|uniref:CDP-diacylglycerol--glycerol-3-phosphate 3-phosphatidyltransferase n=1 Tax=Thermotomaculum hydrothermale TaxID=981385 RepID=A0A7R6PFK4_9BACT|nr:CDP-alcohol phosphatidyltransferase family protein [Thermotomaculum hydrothermale]BBB31659.1 cardiolipin synthase (CMP-forming) [Thermotomaculum hydrothermale]
MDRETPINYIKAFGIANTLTLIRMFLIPVFVISSVYGYHKFAFFTFVIAGITDFLDGFIARYTKSITDVGKILDPMADKVMLISIYVVLSLKSIGNINVIPVWLTLLIIFRDVFIAIGGVIVFFTKDVNAILPSIYGKLSTVFQILGASIILYYNAYGIRFRYMDELVYVIGFFTMLSGVMYLVKGVKSVI